MVSIASGGRIAEDTPGIADAIDGVLGAVRRWCGWHVFPVREDEVILDGPGTRSAQLPTLRLTKVSSVILNGGVLSDKEFSWSRRGWLTRASGVWPEDDQALTVTMTHGFNNAPDLRRIVCATVANLATNPAGLTSLSVGDRSEAYGPRGSALSTLGVLGTDIDILSLYRLPGDP